MIPFRQHRAIGLLSLLLCVPLALAPGACAQKPTAATFDADNKAWTAPAPYVLRPGDDIEVKFYYSPQLNEQQLIRPDGMVSLPYLTNDVTASGLTVDQLESSLETAYAKLLIKPTIEVVLRTANAQRVFVAGAVTQETAVLMTGPTTVSRAISMAQGMKPMAAKSSVVVLRHLPDGKILARRVDYNRIVDGSDPSQNLLLASGDIVYVPQTWIGNIDDFATQFRTALPLGTGLSANYSFTPRSSSVPLTGQSTVPTAGH